MNLLQIVMMIEFTRKVPTDVLTAIADNEFAQNDRRINPFSAITKLFDDL